jgi:hypothetical protein
MMLLYCLNGLVIAHGDDGPTAVPPEVYGTGVRVIPWPHPFGDLIKSGPTPPTDPVTGLVADGRLYAQPTETPDILLGYAAQVRYETGAQGIVFNAASGTINVNTARLDQGLLNNLHTYAMTLQPTDPVTFTQDNVAYALTAQEAIDLFNQVMAHVQNARTIEGDCIADLAKDVVDISTATWSSGTSQTEYDTAAPHNFAVGTTVTISGCNPSTFDGDFTTLTGTTGSVLIVSQATDPGTYSDSGTIRTTPTIKTYADIDAKFAGARLAPSQRKIPKKFRISEPRMRAQAQEF